MCVYVYIYTHTLNFLNRPAPPFSCTATEKHFHIPDLLLQRPKVLCPDPVTGARRQGPGEPGAWGRGCVCSSPHRPSGVTSNTQSCIKLEKGSAGSDARDDNTHTRGAASGRGDPPRVMLLQGET